MSGVIDHDGTQWERCNKCGGWCNILELLYEEPSDKHPYGRDLCQKCGDPDTMAQGPAAVIFLPKESETIVIRQE